MTHLSPGQPAPYFKALDQNGELRELNDFIGRKIVLFFYPRAHTPGCTAQACDLRDNFETLDAQGYKIIGVSPDAVDKLKKFEVKHNLPYVLLSDPEKEVAKTFGVWGPKKFMGRLFDGIHRTTFIIDKDGRIERIIDKVKTKAHADQIFE